MINRQEIIESSINIENIISCLITHHFFPGPAINSNFLQTVLYDQYSNTSFKISVFSKCYPDFPQCELEKIRRIFNIRNIYAHCGLNITSLVDPDKSGVMNSKKPNEPLNFDRLRDEFLGKEKEVLKELEKILNELEAKGLKFLK